MEYVYVNRGGDQEIIADYKKNFEEKSLQELVEAYNKEAKSGIVGVRRQALYLVALNQEFKERLKESPVYLLEHVLGLVGPIEIVDGNIRIVD
jgi:RNase P/RNase MRP subunit POP5